MDNSLLMIWDLFWIIAPTAVYLDATRQRIGKIGKKSFLNMPAGAWGAATLIIGIIALPLYLIKRRSLIAKAKEQPVYVSTTRKVIVSIVLLVLSVAITWLFAGAFESTAQNLSST